MKAGKKTRYLMPLIMALMLILTLSMSLPVFAAGAVKSTSIKNLTSPEPGMAEVTVGTIKGASGYEVRYSMKKNFSNAKTKVFKGEKLWRGKVTGLKQGKKYFVKVRAFKTQNGKKAYSKYSGKKSVKVSTYVVGYTTDYMFHMQTKKKGGYSVSIPYKSKVQVARTIGKRGTDEWVKLKYKGKVYYKYMDAKTVCFSAKGINYSDYKNLGVGTVRQEVVTDAVKVFKNNKTTYVNTSKIKPGSKDSKGRMRFDCSGYTSYIINGVMEQYIPNFELSNGISGQCNKGWLYTDANGKFSAKTVCKGKPDFSKIKPGDLVFFDDNGNADGKCDHVGIYIGNKEFIHSVGSAGGVCIMPMDKGRYKERFMYAKSFVPNKVPAPINKTKSVTKKAHVYSDIKFTEATGDDLAAGETVTLKYVTPCSWDDNKDCCYIEYGNGKTGFIQSTLLADPS